MGLLKQFLRSIQSLGVSVTDGLRNPNFAYPKLPDLLTGISTICRMREATLNRSLFQGGLRENRPTSYFRRDVFCMRILHVVHPATRIAQIRPFAIPTSVRESHLLPYRYGFMCKPIDYYVILRCILYDFKQSNVIFLSHMRMRAGLEILIDKKFILENREFNLHLK